MKILGIETSCDETAAGVVADGRNLLCNIIHSQTAVHSPYGGIVPELAGREHIQRIHPIVSSAIEEVGGVDELDGIAVTYGPGLNGSLLVGLTFAKAFCYGTGLPVYAVNHLEGHLAALRLIEDAPLPPIVVLLVTGGHTAIYYVERWGEYELLGTTIDDAVGEAFDKVARLVGLAYPGGPEIERLALEGDPKAFDFPIPMRRRGCNMSFSGLKTAVALQVKRFSEKELLSRRADIAASFQRAAVTSLTEKLKFAMGEKGVMQCAIVGGVAANAELRNVVNNIGEACFPPVELCGDNGAMIAAAGFIVAERDGASSYDCDAVPNLKL